jgi:phosphate transport system protein
MPREAFERELQRLEDEMLAMASMVEEAMTESVDVLKRRDLEDSQRLIDRDYLINKKRFEIESDCLIAIATQQPMASDLRVIAAIIHIISELERIGDYAKGIARISLMIGTEPLLKPLIDIPRMAEEARSMLHDAVQAFSRRDTELALSIPQRDEVVDALYNQVYRELMTYIFTSPRHIDQVNYLLWVAHNLERSADRVTNICERVVFTVTGKMKEISSDDTGVESIN